MFGEDVKSLQDALVKQGYKLISDGWFGINTQKAVFDFQMKNGLFVDGIVGYNTLNALKLTKQEKPIYLVIHVSATPENVAGWNAQSIVNYHVNMLGWGRPGYGRIIEQNGEIVKTWNIDVVDGIQPFEMTYGVGNRAIDLNALNVCMIGGLDKNGVPKDTRTKEQTESLKKIIFEMIDLHPNILIAGHNQFFNKACPCFFVPKFLAEISIDKKNIYDKDPFGYKQVFK